MKLSFKQAEEIRALYKTGRYSQRAIADMYGLRSQMSVSNIVRGLIYTSERPPETIRFFGKIDTRPGQGPNGDCHEWKGACTWSGYGQFKRDRSCEQINASRLAWEFRHGPIPEGMEVCHHCDNRKCCREEHLFIGTHADNMADRSKKGRHKLIIDHTGAVIGVRQ